MWQNFVDFLLKAVQTVNTYLSNYVLIFLLVGIGLVYTIKTKFVQVRCFGEGMRRTFGGIFKKSNGKGGLSSFQALATAVAAQVGTGNIIGASSAILMGGPGAIFWMWAPPESGLILTQNKKDVKHLFLKQTILLVLFLS